MSEAERAEQKVHIGYVKVTNRVFEDIIGNKHRAVAELALLQAKIDETKWTEESAMIFQTEYGQGICDFEKLPPEAQDYLTNNSFMQLKEALDAVKNEIRERYEECLKNTTA